MRVTFSGASSVVPDDAQYLWSAHSREEDVLGGHDRDQAVTVPISIGGYPSNVDLMVTNPAGGSDASSYSVNVVDTAAPSIVQELDLRIPCDWQDAGGTSCAKVVEPLSTDVCDPHPGFGIAYFRVRTCAGALIFEKKDPDCVTPPPAVDRTHLEDYVFEIDYFVYDHFGNRTESTRRFQVLRSGAGVTCGPYLEQRFLNPGDACASF